MIDTGYVLFAICFSAYLSSQFTNMACYGLTTKPIRAGVFLLSWCACLGCLLVIGGVVFGFFGG